MEALGISINGIIAYIINFALLVILLRLFLYKPVKNALAQRQQRIAESLEAADIAAQEAAQQRVGSREGLEIAITQPPLNNRSDQQEHHEKAIDRPREPGRVDAPEVAAETGRHDQVDDAS